MTRVSPLGRWRQVTVLAERSMARASVSTMCVDALGLLEEVGVAHDPGRGADELVAIVEDATDIVGIAAGGHREIRVFLDQGDGGVLVETARPRGGLRDRRPSHR
jgi:hypothetical protein